MPRLASNISFKSHNSLSNSKTSKIVFEWKQMILFIAHFFAITSFSNAYL